MRKIVNKNLAVLLSFVIAMVLFFPAVSVSVNAAGLKIGVSTSITSQYVGSKITVKATASNGTAPYSFKFLYKVNNGSWVTVKNYTSTNNVSFTASKAGTYTIRSYAKDNNKREIYCDINMTVKEKYVALSNSSTVSSTSITKNNSITVKGLANGGTKPYDFKYYYVDQAGKQTIVKNFCAATSVNVKFTNAGYYTMHCTVKDKDGKVIDKSFNITVKNSTGQALKNTSSLSSYNVFYGGSITINGAATGGNQPYQYEYYYSVNNSAYKKISGYTKSTKQTFKFPSCGYYKIKIIAKDFSGKTAETIKNITVKQNTNKALAITSSINTTDLVDQNTTVTINAGSSGGTLPHRYAFYYKIGNGEWKTIKDYSTTNKVSLKLTGRGLYSLKTTTIDSAGNTKSKINTVTSITKFVSNSTTKNTKVSYGLSTKFNITDGGSGAQYEVYYREPSSTQWVNVQKYSSNKSIKFRPRKLGTTSMLVYTKLNNKITTENFTITTFIPNTVYEELELVNKERQKVGLKSLKLDNDLVFVANVRAEELETKYAHERPNGTKCFTVLNEYSIKTPSFSGENIAWGYPDVKSVMTGWMNSQKHKENILDKNYTKVGVGINGRYWTQMFTS